MSDHATAVERVEHSGAVQRGDLDIESLARMAVEKGKEGVEVLERLMVIRRDMKAESAKEAYYRALAQFQDSCPPIKKNKRVADAYSYAPFEEILWIVKPCMKAHGLSFSLDTDTESKDGWVIVKCRITHELGHSEISTGKFPLGKGTNLMSATQVYASALTFASRRVFCNALGLVTVGEDMDGRNLNNAQRGPTQRKNAQAPADNPPVETPANDVDGLKKQLWTAMRDVRGTDWGTARAWMARHGILTETQTVRSLTAPELVIVLEKVELTLNPPE